MQFEAAMTLANAYDPEQIPYISAAHAEQLEFTYVNKSLRTRIEISCILVEIQIQPLNFMNKVSQKKKKIINMTKDV